MTTDELITRADEIHSLAAAAGQRRNVHVITLVLDDSGAYRIVYPTIGLNTIIGVLVRAVTQLSLQNTESNAAPSPQSPPPVIPPS